jgi:hypothetical protein
MWVTKAFEVSATAAASLPTPTVRPSSEIAKGSTSRRSFEVAKVSGDSSLLKELDRPFHKASYECHDVVHGVGKARLILLIASSDS